MSLAGLSVTLAFGLLQLAAITGQVTGPDGAPVHGARVFVEPGMAGALLETKSDTAGRFQFETVPGEGVGVFAIAPGLAFRGRHVVLAGAGEAADVSIQLAPVGAISGKVTGAKGKPVSGARITRVGILTDPKVGIPLAKLDALGVPEPVTNEQGEFTMTNLPVGAKVVIKVVHPDYAQEAVSNLGVGEKGVRIELSAGVSLRGTVTARNGGQALSGVAVLVRSAQPPNDTALVQTDGAGQFSLRLKPGPYGCQAAGASLRSAGWETFTLTGEQPEAVFNLSVAEAGMVRGEVKDAVSGQPVAGARILVECNGAKAALLHSGAAGGFQAVLAEGEAVLTLEPAPGYLPPEPGGIRVRVAAGQQVELPGMWLKPIPAYRLQVVDEDGKGPVPGAVITLLSPSQLGWRVTGPDGLAELRIASAPADGNIVGFVEDPSRPLGALFQIAAQDHGPARVQLLRLASVTGRVLSADGKPVEGMSVSAVFDNIELWRSISGTNGVFTWNAVVPGVPQHCLIHAATPVESKVFNPQFGAAENLGDITAGDSPRQSSFLAKRLPWRKQHQLQGAAPGVDGPAIVVYSAADQAAALAESLASAREALGERAPLFALVVEGNPAIGEARIPVFSGKPPASATTYVVGADGKVALETFGLPPLCALMPENR